MKKIFTTTLLFTICLNSYVFANSSLTFEASKYETMAAMESKVQRMKASIYLVLNEIGCDGYKGAYQKLKYTIQESGVAGLEKRVHIKTYTICPSPLIITGTQTHFTEWVYGTNYYSYMIQSAEKIFTIRTTEQTILED
ncbi:MAG: hypothetical protein JNM93_04710 [Bacteriovoracaceae bacterium]|nr:hypothetical protein [Bacteriovoracaceae bacterium]